MTIGGVPPNCHKPCFFAKSGVDKKPDFLGILIYFPKNRWTFCTTIFFKQNIRNIHIRFEFRDPYQLGKPAILDQPQIKQSLVNLPLSGFWTSHSISRRSDWISPQELP